MKCNNCMDLIPAILESDTNSSDAKEFFQHIEQCESCNSEYLYQKQAKEDLKIALDIEAFQFYDCTNEILGKIDKGKYKNLKTNSSQKTFMFLARTVVPFMIVVLIAIFLPPIIKDYYNKNTTTNITNMVDYKTKEIISSSASVKIDTFSNLIFYNKQANSIEVTNDNNIITMVNTILQDKNIDSYSKKMTNTSFYDEYNNKDGLMAIIYLKDLQITKFKVNSKEVSIKYNTIKIPFINTPSTKPTIFFSVRDSKELNNSKNAINIDSLTLKDKNTFDKLYAYCTSTYTIKTFNDKPYSVNTNSKSFANLVKKVTSSQKGETITNSGVTYFLDFNISTNTCGLKYFEVLSKDSGIDLLEETVNDKMLLQMTSIIDKKHGEYNLYAICYNGLIKYCFIEQNNKFFSINWNTIDTLTGKTFNQWLKDNNFPKDTIITQRDSTKSSHILKEYFCEQ